ncbi:sce7726 family protein [Clostridium botulinum]|uniref:sce7726 family protein n=1 Tax=Clostridium botulinum TaxID=1491 RepID=UPI0013C9DECA|nr:sce7726 family protein [Clostridium botulinum]MBY7025060.1 sce7726 family protein [Clostridium botulinum]NFE73840.1 sce7726 family protein [Clostridium botulinum]NFG26056.1 sce7726 family protein [Clostridium botulinum]NFL60527.1 sce7726 family protein [Clostridium botulinum]NFL63751.1 sce7726 family protein [Clostridium botulinum]
MEKNNIILNKFFTRSTLDGLVKNNNDRVYKSIAQKYLNDIDNKYNKDVISDIYNVMDKKYRNEYFYKNTLFNKLVLGRHSLNTATALTELPISKSKADFILINKNNAILYEIKTGLDTFERLDAQLLDYKKAFKFIYVVTCESNYEKLSSILKESKVGICILTSNKSISIKKKAIEDSSKLCHDIMFKILRKNEFENVLIKYYGELPQTSQVKYYDACMDMFRNINIDLAHEYLIGQLKKRVNVNINEYKKYVPYELRILSYFLDFKKEEFIKLDKFLNRKFRG